MKLRKGNFMPVLYTKTVTSAMIDNPKVVIVYEGNIIKDAPEGVNERVLKARNSIGLPTKYTPGTTRGDFFKKDSGPQVSQFIVSEIEKILTALQENKTVVFPTPEFSRDNGKLHIKSPVVYMYYQSFMRHIEKKFGVVKLEEAQL